jgi:hypothetical protein
MRQTENIRAAQCPGYFHKFDPYAPESSLGRADAAPSPDCMRQSDLRNLTKILSGFITSLFRYFHGENDET